MGEAKRRAAAREQMERQMSQVDLPRLSSAMQRLSIAASGHLGSDCYTHSAIAQAILARLGVEAKLVVGYAGWRVGEGDSDTILHAPSPEMVLQPGGAIYHVWLEIGDYLLDLTTYQLRAKAAQLDSLDGGHTTVDWCPDYLFVEKRTISPLSAVIQLHAGLYHYSRQPDVENMIVSTSPQLEETDVAAAWLLFQDPDLKVFGPNDLKPPHG